MPATGTEPATEMESLQIMKYASKALSKATKSLIILDSSFNPPHSAHLAMIRTALRSKHDQPAAVLLMYATKNADKDTKEDQENDTRVDLMQAFSSTVSELCETHICLTKHPYFVDKFRAVRDEMPAAEQTYIVGYDTFVRILDKKYYPDQDLSKSGLDEFFQHGKLLCAIRGDDDKWGNSAAQREHIQSLSAGRVDGVPAEWGRNIEILTLEDGEALGVSSSKIRNAVASGDETYARRHLTSQVLEVIRHRKLYLSTENEIKFPYLTREHIMHCSFSAWHAKFKHISPRARVIKPLPLSFIEYLNEDGLVLPQDSRTITKKIEELLDSDASDTSDFEDEGFSEEDPTESFVELHEQIQREMRALGGAVVPKLNWSTPKDALWITADKTLKCTSPNDIYLLLKSSDFIVHDLERAFESCDGEGADGDHGGPVTPLRLHEHELVLKKWFNAQPSMEFRCFVKEGRLVAISQRDVNHYAFLTQQTEQIVLLASRLHRDHLADHFPDPNFVFDMYASVEQDKAWLMDINPYCRTTDALLFAWSEILAMPSSLSTGTAAETGTETPEMRLVSADSIMSHGPRYSAHQVPLELIETSDGVDPATFAEEFQRKLARATFDS